MSVPVVCSPNQEKDMNATVETIKSMVDSLWSDTTCSQDETRERLEEIVEHIDGCLEALD